MSNRVSGGLLGVLKYARTAWYHGQDGTTAYYEQPSYDATGVMIVNGQLVTRLVVDHEGHYVDFPSPRVQHMLIERGVRLDCGWTCQVEVIGQHIKKAMQESPCQAVRHHNAQVTAQRLNETTLVIFVKGIPYWRVDSSQVHQAFAELGITIEHGWYPVHQDLLQLTQVPYGSAQLMAEPSQAVVSPLPSLDTQRAVVIRAGDPISSTCYGSTIIVSIESSTNKFPQGLTVGTLRKMVTYIPGLQGYQCRVTRRGNDDLVSVVYESAAVELEPAHLILWFSRADSLHFPDGVSAQTLVDFMHFCSQYGLRSHAMRLTIDSLGFVQDIALLQPGWKSHT